MLLTILFKLVIQLFLTTTFQYQAILVTVIIIGKNQPEFTLNHPKGWFFLYFKKIFSKFWLQNIFLVIKGIIKKMKKTQKNDKLNKKHNKQRNDVFEPI
jgi:hypothetical protein